MGRSKGPWIFLIKKLRDEYTLSKTDDIALVDKVGFDEILGTEKNRLIKRRRLSSAILALQKVINKNDNRAALRRIGINTEQIQRKEIITYNAKEFLHRLPSVDSIRPKYDRKSTLSMKVIAATWAVIAVTCSLSIAPMRSFLIDSTGWG